MRKNRSKQVSHELQFNVAQLLKESIGDTRSYDVDVENIGQFDEEVNLVSPIVGQVDFMYTGSDILVTGSLKTTIQKNCGRCLASFTTPVSIKLEEEFYPSVDILTGAVQPKLPDVDETNYIDELHILGLTEVVRQEVFLEGAGFLYCRSNCKGLCPHCGQDRNVNPCTCQDDIIDPRWADLQALQTED